MTEHIKTELFCLHCNKECPHTITYLGNHLKEVKCEECGIQLEIDKLKIMEHYAEDFLERVLSKPQKLTEEIKKGLTTFMKSLPVRIIKKPYRVSKEVLDIIKDSLRK
ncbi:MAG: bh protein [Candidatus Omnitrophica bacterium]|nr:bh protein [Candidatus Omnitrophota bacterium]MCK4422625.1 bh protein [Candidatus Omnitrophota bacterium]